MSALDPKYAPRAEVGKCRSCGARIIWCLTEAGKRMPVDYAPTDNGNVAIRPEYDAGRAVWVAVYAKPSQPVEGCSDIRRTSHFATCPQAKGWRR